MGGSPYWYTYDPAGNLLWAPLGALGEDELTEPVAGRVLASYTNGRTATYFKHPNALGSWGLTSQQDGSVPQDELYYPWGQTWTAGHYLWETKYAAMGWRDAESGLDWTPARFYVSSPGRWMSPDPVSGSVTIPQSWNRYAYALNNPTTLTDPSGRCLSTVCGGNGHIHSRSNELDAFGGDILFGYTIFDAMEGAPGTYMTMDGHGNLGFGFSTDLYNETWNYIDTQKGARAAGGGDLKPSDVPTSGYTVTVQNIGSSVVVSGIIPHLDALVQERNQIASMLPSGAQDICPNIVS